MSSQSRAERTRETQVFAGVQAPTQNSPPREMSPSPHDRQRTLKSQSMPIIPSVMQLMSAANAQPNQRQSQQGNPASLNMLPQSKRSTPQPVMQPPQGKVSKLPSPPVQPSHIREDVVQEHYSPGSAHVHSQSLLAPPPMHSISQPNIHAHAQANSQMGYPREVDRNAPRLLTSYHTVEENWQMTDELMAEIERAEYAQALSQQPLAPGTVGVAYAGGAQSGPVYVCEAPAPYEDSVLGRVRRSGHNSPGDLENGRHLVHTERERHRDIQPTNESVQVRNRPLPATPGSSQVRPQPRNLSPKHKSPPYLTTQSSSSEGAASGDYGSFKREPYQPPHTRIPTPPSTVRKPSGAPVTSDLRTTPPAASKLASQTPPLQAMKTRTPDKSLPIQEEQEDDIALKSTGHLQYDHGSDLHRDGGDDDAIIENDHEYAHNDNDEDGGSGSYMPRSPSASLPEPHYIHPVNQRVASIAKYHRNGSTDQLGLQSFDAVVNQGVPARTAAETQPPSRPQQNRMFNEARDNCDQRSIEVPQQAQQNFNHNHRLHTLYTQVHVDNQNYDDPTATYLQTYLQPVRPNAPIPPTPHSQAIAPSPSPLVSSIQPSSAAVGSPYPFPFSHVRRNVAYAPPTAPSTTYDPASIEEKTPHRMQMYAPNEPAVLSDSTFSPSSARSPGSGYDPWTFLQSTRASGGTRHRFDSMSMRSSPSHLPVMLPALSSRGRGLKRREKSVNLRKAVTSESASRDRVQPPLRAESTQPRDTSPEPYSSGEEIAGEKNDMTETVPEAVPVHDFFAGPKPPVHPHPPMVIPPSTVAALSVAEPIFVSTPFTLGDKTTPVAQPPATLMSTEYFHEISRYDVGHAASNPIMQSYHSTGNASAPVAPQATHLWSQPARFNVNVSSQNNYDYGSVRWPYADSGWTEYTLPHKIRCFGNPDKRATTDLDLRNLMWLEAVEKVMEDALERVAQQGVLACEIWIRRCPKGMTCSRKRKDAVMEELEVFWVYHNYRRISNDLLTDDGVVSGEDDCLDEEYKYWSYVEMHPAFTILSRKSVQEAVDTLHWSSTDRLFALPHTNQPPFGQEECEELLKLLNDSNRQRDPSYTRIIARIHLRLAHWHQAHFRSHKLLPCGAIITHQSKQTWFLLGMMVEELFGMLSVDIQSYVDKTRCSGRYDGKGSARTCTEMSFVMVVMFSIILGGFVMLLSFLVSGTMHLFAGLFSVLCIATSVLLFLRHFSNMH